jgi:predicted dehydrogenase
MARTVKAKKAEIDKKIRIGIIGTGGIAHAHMRAYMSMDDVEVVGGADIVPGKARAFFDELVMPGAKAFENFEDLLKLDLDGVSVCTYNSTHALCSIGALGAGVNVLCEKPMSVTLGDAVAMVRAQKAAGKILTIGFQPRYDPDMIMVRDIVQSGILGKIYYVQTGGGRRRGMPGGNFIRKELSGMGALGDIGCYGLDLALNSIGYPKPLTVSAYANNVFGTNPKYSKEYMHFEVDDFSVALIRLEGDIALDFRMAWAMHMNKMGDTLFLGSDAGLRVESPGADTTWGGAWDGTIGPVYLYNEVNDNLAETRIPLKGANVDRFKLKVRAFVDAIISGGPDPIPASQILYNQAIIDGIMRSSDQKREVAIEIPEI